VVFSWLITMMIR